jgi:serine protease Do
VLGHDRRLGVALLRADLGAAGRGGTPYVATALPPAPASSFQAGRFVLAIGNPFGARQRPDPLLALGILSRFHPADAPAAWRGHWQTDASGLDTNCGGAAVDLDGRLLGLFTIWHPGRHGRNSGIAFVLPWADVVAALPALERGQGPARGFLGVSFAPGRAARVAEVIAGTPAQAAGLRVGDVIERVDREDVATAAAVISVLGHRCEGEGVVLAVDRDGIEREIRIVLTARPSDAR